jgi:NAD+ diphosphatase
MPSLPAFMSAAVDRAAHLRHAPTLPLRGDELVFVVDQTGVLVDSTADTPRLALRPASTVPDDLLTHLAFHGLDEAGARLFSLDVTGFGTAAAEALAQAAATAPLLSHWQGAAALDLRSAAAALSARDAGLAAHARALSWFHRTHRFCGRCGAPTQAVEAGNARRCTGTDPITGEPCGHTVYPRNDAAVIVLVHKGDMCLLGRGHRLPPGVFSTLAGFVEAAETLEDCVHRELMEEVGVRVARPVYQASQPWPFPQSLMVGFTAEALDPAEDSTLRIDHEEIDAAHWYHRSQVLTALAGSPEAVVQVPTTISIAHWLIRRWAEGQIG